VTNLNRNYPVETLLFKLIVHYISRDDSQVRETLLFGLGVDIDLLCS
jgi:hypothetical protein